MAPTIFADKETPHTRKKRIRHMRHKISGEIRNVARYHNSPVMTTINNYATTNNTTTKQIKMTRNDVRFREDNVIQQMDSEDEEVNEIISSQKLEKCNDLLQFQSNIKNTANDLHKFDSKQKMFTNIKPIAVFSTLPRTNDRQANLLKKQAQPSIKNGTVTEQITKTTYADLCELKNSEGLLAIALKTIKLIKRNQLLQRRLSQLQLETSHFIASVLSNPENRQVYDKSENQKNPTATF